MVKYRKKPVVVEAEQFTRENLKNVEKFVGDKMDVFIERRVNGIMYGNVSTLEGMHRASEGDYIIKGVKGEFYPCKPDIFDKTYEIVE